MVNPIAGIVNSLFHNQNQFASGGMLLLGVGAVGSLFRAIPQKCWSWIVHQTTISLIVTDENDEFDWLRAWLEEQNLMKRSRHIDIGTGNRRMWWRPNRKKTILAPAPGYHWMAYRKRPLSVKVTRLDDTKSGERRESIQFTTLGRNQNFFRGLVQEISEKNKNEAAQPRLYVWNKDRWREMIPYYPRSLDSVILPGNMKNEMIQDIADFKNSQSWYAQMGIPYHRGYLLEGPPGTGKTSFITGLSNYFKAKVYVLKINTMTDATLRDAVLAADSGSFIVLEDIDCVAASVKRIPEKSTSESALADVFGVTQSGLLNILDGLFAPVGGLFFMTTNHPDRLDPALIRPGRVDVRKHIGLPDECQKEQFFNRFFPNKTMPPEYAKDSMTMADLQKILLADTKPKQLARAAGSCR